MFDIEAFILNHDYFVAVDDEDDYDEDIDRNIDALDQIEGELEGVNHG